MTPLALPRDAFLQTRCTHCLDSQGGIKSLPCVQLIVKGRSSTNLWYKLDVLLSTWREAIVFVDLNIAFPRYQMEQRLALLVRFTL